MREEGTNGDRELAAAFHLTGRFEPVDVTMSDLLHGTVPAAAALWLSLGSLRFDREGGRGHF